MEILNRDESDEYRLIISARIHNLYSIAKYAAGYEQEKNREEGEKKKKNEKNYFKLTFDILL